MSFTDNLLLWLHVAIAVFAIGPLTVATMSTPRYVRRRDLPVLRYLARITRIYAVISLAVLIVGGVLAQLRDDFGKPWLIVSMTLFVVALVLLLLIVRDQRGAIVAIEAAAKSPSAGHPSPGGDAGTGAPAEGAPADATVPAGTGPAAGTGATAGTGTATGTETTAAPPPVELQLAAVERGRIASLAGVVSIIWLVILALMVWAP